MLNIILAIIGIVIAGAIFIIIAFHFDTIKAAFKEALLGFVAALLLLIVINAIAEALGGSISNLINGVAWLILTGIFIYIRWRIAPKKPKIS